MNIDMNKALRLANKWEVSAESSISYHKLMKILSTILNFGTGIIGVLIIIMFWNEFNGFSLLGLIVGVWIGSGVSYILLLIPTMTITRLSFGIPIKFM